jgi:EAL domain-containing protein (putative c-di-GMP-specific phosphodiesterase class I)
VSTLSELQELGLRVAVDDFGTGYSSLSHLQQFPVDVLKIDRAFICPLNREGPEGAALLTSIIDMAHTLNLQVVAEGIEDEYQLEALAEMGCLFGQGFLLGRPLSADAASDLIEAANTSTAI